MMAVTTKEQERKALEKIRKTVEELGENSYIGMAFEGCFEIAEENIDKDFGCSMKQKFEDEAQKAQELFHKNTELRKELAEAREVEVTLNTRIEKLEARRNELLKQVEESSNSSVKNWNKFREQEERADKAEAEIIQLKAKLYDLLIAKE